MDDKQLTKSKFNHGLKSCKSDEWSTPQDFYDMISDNGTIFTLDPCATHENHKCEKYYTVEDDGLNKSWRGEMVFCNPPYSAQKDWIQKAIDEGVVAVFLIPARTDTKLFHDVILPNAVEISFIKGRLKFGGSKNSAPFPSMLVLFDDYRNSIYELPEFGTMYRNAQERDAQNQ